MRNIELLNHPNALLSEKIEQLRDLRRDRDAINREYDEAKAEVEELMGNAVEAFNEQNQLIATFTTEANNRFDKKSFEIVYPGIYEKFTIHGTKRVFRFK